MLPGTLTLDFRDCCTSAAFAYTGVEIVAMTAAEAKYPKRDFPFAAKCTWLITIGLYVSSVLFVSLCVPWTSSKLLNPKSKFTGAVSPFVIAIDEAGYAVLPGLANAGFLFAAWTAANTQLYVASRTLYGMCQGMTPTSNPWLWPLGRTRKMNGAPVMAILASCIFAPLAFLLCATSNAQKVSEDWCIQQGSPESNLTPNAAHQHFQRHGYSGVPLGLGFSMSCLCAFLFWVRGPCSDRCTED